MKSTRFFAAILVVSALLILLIQLSCTSPTEPELQPGRRDYVWTVDTLNAPYDTYYRMWGSSPSDVWAVSSGDWNKSIAHFDGKFWSFYGVSGMNVPHSIYGFSSNDVYIGTAGGGVWHYDGNKWKQIVKLKKDGHEDIVFDNLWGESQNSLYASGAYPDEYGYNNSVIAHFFNNKWEVLSTNELYGLVEHLYRNSADDKIYLQVVEMGGGRYVDSTHIYEIIDEEYKQIYSSVWTKGKQADISLIDDEVYFILGNEIATRVNNQFQTVINIDNPNFYQRIWGRNSKDVFLLMLDGLVHYNGNDMEYLFYFNKTPRTQIYGAALFDKDVFFLVDEATSHLKLIYHGKIK